MAYTFQVVDNSADPTFNQALGIDDAGTIAGYYGAGVNTHPNVGYTVSQGVYSAENVPGAAQTQVTAINNLGQTVGFSVDAGGVNTGFVRNADGSFTSVASPATPAAAPAFNQLLGINDLGVAVGFYIDANGASHSYSYDIATQAFTAMPDIAGFTSTVATAINDAGTIVGYASGTTGTEGFVDSGGVVTMLTGPDQQSPTLAFGLNNQGQIVGQYTDAGGVGHGFVYDVATATYSTIDDPNGAAGSTVVNGINDQGELVGFSTAANGNVNGFSATPPGLARIADPIGGSTIDVAPGSDGVSVGGSNAVTLVDHATGNAQIVANAGSDLIVTTELGDTIVGGSGNDTIFLRGQDMLGRGGQPTTTGSFGDQAVLGSGTGMVISSTQDTISATTGQDTIFASGAALAEGGRVGSSMLFIDQNGQATVVGGAGSLIAFGGAGAAGEVIGGSAETQYVGAAGRSTFIGGTGSAFVYAGTGGGLVQGGSGSLVFVGATSGGNLMTIDAGSGAASIYAASGNSVVLNGAASDVITATTGNVTLVGGASSGNNTILAGTGNDVLSGGTGGDSFFLGSGFSTIAGGGGSDAFIALFGDGGGTTRIEDFNTSTDHFYLSGYAAGAAATALSTAVVSGGSTTVTLSDNSHITFVGVTQLSATAFG